MEVEDSTVGVVSLVVATAAAIGAVAGELTHLTRDREATLPLGRQLVTTGRGCHHVERPIFDGFVGIRNLIMDLPTRSPAETESGLISWSAR